jgi:hypothetical protein
MSLILDTSSNVVAQNSDHPDVESVDVTACAKLRL